MRGSTDGYLSLDDLNIPYILLFPAAYYLIDQINSSIDCTTNDQTDIKRMKVALKNSNFNKDLTFILIREA